MFRDNGVGPSLLVETTQKDIDLEASNVTAQS